MTTLEYIVDPGGRNELTLDESEIVRHNPIKTHTGKADLTATLAYNRSLDDYAKRQDRLNIKIDGTVQWTGFVVNVSHNKKRATTRLKADGIAKKLEETRPDYSSLGGKLTYTNIALEDAIDDYWGRTPFSTYSVTSQTTNTVATGQTVQSADTTTEWNEIVDIPDTTPVGVKNGELTLLQDCFLAEAETEATTNFDNVVSNVDFSDGEGVELQNSGDKVSYSFTLDHDVPSDDFRVGFRYDARNTTDAASFDLKLDGSTVVSGLTGSLDGNLDWFTNAVNSEVTAGSHTVELETTENNGNWQMDLIVAYDNRGNKNLDNSVNTNGYLDGPELYPDDVGPVETTVDKTSFNITAADVTSTWDDTSGFQSIQVSKDGTTWKPSGGTENNTDSISVSSFDPGREIRTRFTFDRYGQDDFDTPTQGRKGQSIDSYDLSVDGNDLVVIDKLDLSRNHFDNLQELHDYGNFLWVIEHSGGDIANLTVSSFLEGDETRTAPDGLDDPHNQMPTVQSENYFNSVYVQGSLDSNGNRPAEEIKDQTAINNDGREISPGVLRDPKVTTESGATFRARSLLNQAQTNNNLKGQVVVPPVDFTHPGYAYPVDFGDGGNDKTAETVTLTESDNEARIKFDFVPPSNLGERISNLRRNARGQGDQI